MGRSIKESNEIPDPSQWKINRPGPRRYQTKQSKLKPTENLSVTSYYGWVTTEDILKSEGHSRTTIGKLARLNHKSQSTSRGKELKIRLGALSTAIPQSQIKHHFHHSKKITDYNSFYHNGSESTSIFVANHERPHESSTTADSSILIQDSLLSNTNIKVDRMDIGNSYINKVELKESIGISTLTQPSSKLSISNPIVDKQASRVNTVISRYLSGGGEKIKSCGLRGEHKLDIENDVLEEKSVRQKNCGESFPPEYSDFEEFNQEIDDVDFLAAEPDTLTSSDKLLPIEKESYSTLIHSPSLSAVSGKSLSVTYQKESKVNCCSIDRKFLSLPASKHDNISERPVVTEISQGLLQENQTCLNEIIAKKIYQKKTFNLEKDINENLLESKESKFQAGLRGCVALEQNTRAGSQQSKLQTVSSLESKSFLDIQDCELASRSVAPALGSSNEFYDPGIFSRIEFPKLVNNDSPIIGLSSNNCLRTCFHVKEMINEAQRFMTLNTAPVIELFARVIHSYREPNTTRQKFHFSDIWLDKSSFSDGILMNYKATKLIDEESQIFIGSDSKKLLARILATPKRREEKGLMNQNTVTTIRSYSCWLLHIISIRKTDFEEINWTRRIVNAY
ncbi:hypothetical protein EPUL_003854 [Erysiphe pulchra]|uniref:Uncharacterized protein n=1 Tax=Erysiphe pulchra TaxID=225359 RepID=A0A2S4PQF1_9PEZI|nr:hypothetical protein EPUL_003854 [Erysiphe pulchra]